MGGRQITHQICFDMLWSLTIIKERKNPNTMALKCEHVHIIFIKSSLSIGDLFSLKMARPPSPLKSMSRIVVDCFCAPSMTHLPSFILFVVECWPTDYFIIDHAKETDFKAIIREYGQGCRKPSTRQCCYLLWFLQRCAKFLFECDIYFEHRHDFSIKDIFTIFSSLEWKVHRNG